MKFRSECIPQRNLLSGSAWALSPSLLFSSLSSCLSLGLFCVSQCFKLSVLSPGLCACLWVSVHEARVVCLHVHVCMSVFVSVLLTHSFHLARTRLLRMERQ